MKIYLSLISCFLFYSLQGQVVSMSPSTAFQNQTFTSIIKLAPGVIQAGNPPSVITDVFLKQGDSIIYTNAFTSAQIFPGAAPYTDSLTADFTIPVYAKPGWYEVHVKTYDLFNSPIDNILTYGFVVRLPGSCPVPFNISADTITGSGTSEIISWDPSVIADTFRIRYRESGTSNYFYKDVPGAGNVTFDTIFGLFSGALYYIDVSTICGGVHSTYSAPVDTFTTLPQTFSCVIPYSISLSFIANTSVQVSWTDYVTATTFRVRYFETDTTTARYVDVNGAGPHNVTLLNLRPGTTYKVQVSSVCLGVGTGYSFIRSFTTVASPTSCVKPWATDTSNITNSTATIQWTPLVTADTFRIRCSVFGSTNYFYFNSPGLSGNSKTITDLVPNTTYQYQVSAVCLGQGSGYSPSRLFTTVNAPVLCGKPYGLTTSNITNSNADISWTNMITADSFLIRYSINGSTNYTWKKIVGSSFSTNINGLVGLTTYQWQVRSLCSGAPSPYSLPVTFGTPPKLAHPVSQFFAPEIFPNPAFDFFSIRFTGNYEGNAQLLISDLSGRILSEKNYPVYVGTNELGVDAASFASGIYFIELKDDEMHFKKQLLITR